MIEKYPRITKIADMLLIGLFCISIFVGSFLLAIIILFALLLIFKHKKNNYPASSLYLSIFVILSVCCFESIGLLLCFMAVSFLWFEFKNGTIQPFHIVDFVVLCLFLVEIIVGSFNNQGIYAIAYFWGLFFNVLIYFIIRVSLKEERQENMFINILADFVILMSVLTIFSFYFFNYNIENKGFPSLVNLKNMFHPMGFLLNDWATILLLSISFVLLALVRSRFNTPLFWTLVVGLGLVLMGIVFSFSRGAYLSVLLGLLVFFGFGFIFRTVPVKSLLIILIGVVFLITLSVLPVKKDFLTTIGLSGTTSQVRSTSGRVELWKAAFRLIRKNPCTGVGNGQFSLHANPYLASREDATITRRATNSYLQLLAEKGIIGFIPWAVLVCLLLFTVLKLVRDKSEKSLSSLLLLVVFMATLFRELSFSTFFEKQQMQLLFWVLAAWTVNQDKSNMSSFSSSRLPLLVLLSGSFIVLTGYRVLYKIATKRNNGFIEKYQEENYNDALTLIDKALKIDPDNSILLVNKGFLLQRFSENVVLLKINLLE